MEVESVEIQLLRQILEQQEKMNAVLSEIHEVFVGIGQMAQQNGAMKALGKMRL